nr:hypothetical protein [Butyrivibrio sp.]
MKKSLQKISQALLAFALILIIASFSKINAQAATTGLSISSRTQSSITLIYTKTSGTTYYYGYGTTKADALTDAIALDNAVTSGSSFTISNLSCGTTYYICIVAGSSESDQKAAVYGSTYTLEGPVTNLDYKWRTISGKVIVSWDEQTAATGYHYVIKNVTSSKTIATKTTTNTSLTFSGLSNDSIYKFTITPYITSYDSSSDDDNEKVIYFIPQPNVEETDTGFDISIKNKKL